METVETLRTRAREACDKSDYPKTWIAAADRQTLVDFLDNGIVPVSSNGNGHKQEATPENNPESNAEETITLLRKLLGNSINPEQVRKIVTEELAKQAPGKLEITLPGREAVTIPGKQHRLFPLLLKALLARTHDNNPLNINLVGPAGTGKSRIAESLAQALQLNCYQISFSAQTSKTDLLGGVTASGYVPSQLYLACKNGGIMLLDELDRANAGVAIIANAAMANRRCNFPNGETVVVHSDTYFIAGSNTMGTGATEQYQAGNALDAATLDRFIRVYFDIDPALESSFAGVNEATDELDPLLGGTITPGQWLRAVRVYRMAVQACNLRHIISPRATIHGTALINAGFGKTWLEQWIIMPGLTPEQQRRLQESYLSLAQ